MAINISSSNLGTRENRLGAVTGYVGTVGDIIEKSKCGKLKGCSRCFKQSSSCQSYEALTELAAIRDVAVIHHGPAGCSVTSAFICTAASQVAAKRGIENHTVYIGTDMNENDTIFGSMDQLKDIILMVNERYHPKAIFVGSSCVSGIIGEDLDNVVESVKDQISVPVVSVHCEGFKSRVWATGFDLSDHAVLRGIVKPPKKKTNTIIFKNFFEAIRLEIIDIFKHLDLEVQFIYANSTVEELEHLSEAAAMTCICGTLGNYLGNGLEELYGVPYIRSFNQIGIIGFEKWFREIARVVHKEEAAEEYIKEQRAIYIPQIEEVKKELKGLKAVVGMGPGYAFEVARALDELGIEVVKVLPWHYDRVYEDGKMPIAMEYWKERNVNLEITVTDQQNFEVMNILHHYKPDFYVARHPGTSVWAIKQGVPAVYVTEYACFGYKHTLEFAKTILNTVRNRSFEVNLAKRVKLPYTQWWYNQDIGRFIESGRENG